MALCSTAEASTSSPTRMASSVFLLILSDGSSPKGSSPDLRSGLRHLSKISRKPPLLARAPRKPSSSFNSTLKLSTSTDGRRVAPWRAMPVVVAISSAILPLPNRNLGYNGRGTHWFHGADRTPDAAPGGRNDLNPSYLAVFRGRLP